MSRSRTSVAGARTAVVRDHRFERDYEIASHCDYWDFIAALVGHKQYVVPPLHKEVESKARVERIP
jgi:hypothetical protein